MSPPQPGLEAVKTALQEIVNTATPLERAESLQRHAATLMSDEVERILDSNAARLRASGDPDGAAVMESVAGLVRLARARGVEAALARLRWEERRRRLSELLNARWSEVPKLLKRHAGILVDPESTRELDALLEVNRDNPDASAAILAARGLIRQALETDVQGAADWWRDLLLSNFAKEVKGGEDPAQSAFVSELREMAGVEGYVDIHVRIAGVLLRELPPDRAVEAIEALVSAAPSPAQNKAPGSIFAQLALWLLEEPTGDRVEGAIRLLRTDIADLSVRNCRFAGVYGTLGRAYLLRQRGEHAENCRAACETLERELAIATEGSDPDNLLLTHRLLCEAYSGVGDAASAATHFQAALDIEPPAPGEAAAQAKVDLAHLRVRIQAADRESAVEAALADLEAASAQAPPGSSVFGWANAFAAELLRERQAGDRRENFARALKHMEAALAVFRREQSPNEWAQMQHNLGAVYLHDIRGERAANIERALSCFDRALEIHTREDYPAYYGLTCTASALALLEREAGDRFDNLERARQRLDAAATVLDRESQKVWWAQCQATLGALARERAGPHRAQHLRTAVKHLEAARQCYLELGNQQRVRQMDSNLGAAYIDLGEFDPAAYEQARLHLERVQAGSSREQEPYFWAIYQRNLAAALVAQPGVGSEVRARARSCLKAALEIFAPGLYPAEARDTLRYLGHVGFDEQDWEGALDHYEAAIRLGESLLASSYTEAGRLSASRDTALEHVRAAYCLRKLGSYDRALLMLEAGRARLMTEAIAVSGIQPRGVPTQLIDRLQEERNAVRTLEAQMRHAVQAGDEPTGALADQLKAARERVAETFTEVRKFAPYLGQRFAQPAEVLDHIPPGSVLVAFVTTSHGSFAFVVKGGTDRLSEDNIVDIEGIGTDWVGGLLDERRSESWTSLLRAASVLETPEEFLQWCSAMDQFAAMLWTSVMAPVHARLCDFEVPPEAEIILLPQGGLWRLPLHASWRQVNGCRRAFADDHLVSYAPSLFVRKICGDRLAQRAPDSLSFVAVVSPTRDLEYADREAAVVSKGFGTAHLLAHDRARRQQVLEWSATANYLHFCCHGSFDWANVMRSGLELAPPERLTLDDILSLLTLDACRLVTISACETGLTDIRLVPEEYLGLPAGFLLAGASGVISSLWKVDDGATCLLMTKLYERHVAGGRPLPVALREAQQWLRALKMEDLRTLAPDFGDLTARYRALFGDAEPEFRLFDTPFFWGAFVLTGV